MANSNDFNEQERGRRESLAKLRELGINPYPAPLYPVDTTTAEIAAGYDPEKCTDSSTNSCALCVMTDYLAKDST